MFVYLSIFSCGFSLQIRCDDTYEYHPAKQLQYQVLRYQQKNRETHTLQLKKIHAIALADTKKSVILRLLPNSLTGTLPFSHFFLFSIIARGFLYTIFSRFYHFPSFCTRFRYRQQFCNNSNTWALFVRLKLPSTY